MKNIYINHLNSVNLGDYINKEIFKNITDTDKYNLQFICITDLTFIKNLKEDDIVIFGIGSIIHNAISIYKKIKEKFNDFTNMYIYSSGLMYKITNFDLKNINFLSIRGPLTDEILNLKLNCYGDLALILPLIKKRKNYINHTYEYDVGIIPHCVELDGTSPNVNRYVQNFCSGHRKSMNKNSKILFINICENIDIFLKKIHQCRYIISSSLHGIIFCDAYNIPAYHVQLTNRIGGGEFKYRDYFLSVSREYFKINLDNDVNKLIKQFKLYDKKINLNKIINSYPFIEQNIKKEYNNLIDNNYMSYLDHNFNAINIDNIDQNISVVISSCMVDINRKYCLFRTVKNILFYLPNSEIIICFDKKGLNIDEFIENKITNIKLINHDRGLGHSFNYGSQVSKNNIILQIEDDWIIQNKNILNKTDFKNLLFKCLLVLKEDKQSCVRLDGAMFDEIGGSNSYQNGYTALTNDKFNYYKYNLPTKQQMDNNFWLHYAFCNHPHLKLKENVIKNPYPELCNPGELENKYSTEWILKRNNVYFVPINDECIYPLGTMGSGNRNIFKHIGNDTSYRK